MKANELRIGNYIQAPSGKCIPLIDGLSIDFIKNYKPIPLTEEWLLKFNFKEVKKDQWRFVNRLVIKRNDSFFDYASEVELKYVHKLQNFFFETSTELTLNK